MQTIVTKYHSATNHLGARISATSSGGTRIVLGAYGPSINTSDEASGHREAAKHLMRKLGWSGKRFGGHTKNSMVWVHPEDIFTIDVDPPEGA